MAVCDSLKKASYSNDLCSARAHRNTEIWTAGTRFRSDPPMLSVIHWKAWLNHDFPQPLLLNFFLSLMVPCAPPPVNSVSKPITLWRGNVCDTVVSPPRTYQRFFTVEQSGFPLHSFSISFHDTACGHTSMVSYHLPCGVSHQFLNLLFPHSSISETDCLTPLMATVAY